MAMQGDSPCFPSHSFRPCTVRFLSTFCPFFFKAQVHMQILKSFAATFFTCTNYKKYIWKKLNKKCVWEQLQKEMAWQKSACITLWNLQRIIQNYNADGNVEKYVYSTYYIIYTYKINTYMCLYIVNISNLLYAVTHWKTAFCFCN